MVNNLENLEILEENPHSQPLNTGFSYFAPANWTKLWKTDFSNLIARVSINNRQEISFRSPRAS